MRTGALDNHRITGLRTDRVPPVAPLDKSPAEPRPEQRRPSAGIPSAPAGGRVGLQPELLRLDRADATDLKVRRAVDAYRALDTQIRREQISSLLGLDEYA